MRINRSASAAGWLRHRKAVCPEPVATGPRQVCSWDITKLRGPAKGIYYDAYVMIDIYCATSSGSMFMPANVGC